MLATFDWEAAKRGSALRSSKFGSIVEAKLVQAFCGNDGTRAHWLPLVNRLAWMF
jgi:hypothetical protein